MISIDRDGRVPAPEDRVDTKGWLRPTGSGEGRPFFPLFRGEDQDLGDGWRKETKRRKGIGEGEASPEKNFLQRRGLRSRQGSQKTPLFGGCSGGP